MGTYKITAYCGCRSCSGKWGNRTASGRRAKQDRTISVDRRKIKLGTKVRINGKTFIAEDVGSKVKGKHIDMYFSSHKSVTRFGKKYMKYTFDNRCQEVSNLSFEDGTTKIFLNTKGKIYNVSKELQDALRYLEKPIIKEDSLQLSKMIEAQFRKAMSDQKWRQDVKAMEIRYQELLQEGRIEGRAEGRNDREMEIVLGMIEEGASDEMILKYLKISKERLEQIKKNQKVHV